MMIVLRTPNIIQRMSLKSKFLLILLFSSGLSLLFACTVLVGNNVLDFRQSLVKKLTDQAGLVGENSSAALVFHDQQTAEEIVSAFQHQSNVLQAILLNHKGDVLAQYQPGPIPNLSGTSTEILTKVSWETVEIIRPIIFNDEHVGFLYIQSNLEAMHDHLKNLLIIMITAMVISILLALLISSRLQQSLLSPLVNLTDVATRISASQDLFLTGTCTCPG